MLKLKIIVRDELSEDTASHTAELVDANGRAVYEGDIVADADEGLAGQVSVGLRFVGAMVTRFP